MGRKLSRSAIKRKEKFYEKGNMYICNIKLSQAVELVCSAEDEKKVYEVVLDMVIAGLGCLVIAQISDSAQPEKSEWVEKLSSVKHIKTKIINGKPGLALSAVIGMTIAFPSALKDLSEQGDDNVGNNFLGQVELFTTTYTTNEKRIVGNSKNWNAFARGEMGAAKGQLLSCPTSNLKILGIDGSEIKSYGVSEAIEKLGLDSKVLSDLKITPQIVKDEFRKIFLIDNTGKLMSSLIYDEPAHIKSKIQNEILGDSLIRTAEIKSELVKGAEPTFMITKAALNEFLTKNELFAYNIAIRTGDSIMAKKLTDIAIVRSKADQK